MINISIIMFLSLNAAQKLPESVGQVEQSGIGEFTIVRGRGVSGVQHPGTPVNGGRLVGAPRSGTGNSLFLYLFGIILQKFLLYIQLLLNKIYHFLCSILMIIKIILGKNRKMIISSLWQFFALFFLSPNIFSKCFKFSLSIRVFDRFFLYLFQFLIIRNPKIKINYDINLSEKC